MPLDPATLCARTATGDAELAAPRHGLAIAQRRLLSFLDQPLGIDELVRRPGVIPERLERDLSRLVENGLVEIHRPAVPTAPAARSSTARTAPGARASPMGPASRRGAPGPPSTAGLSTSAPSGGAGPGAPVVIGRKVRRGRALAVGFLALATALAAIWYFAAPETPGTASTPAGPAPATTRAAPGASVAAVPPVTSTALPAEPTKTLGAAELPPLRPSVSPAQGLPPSPVPPVQPVAAAQQDLRPSGPTAGGVAVPAPAATPAQDPARSPEPTAGALPVASASPDPAPVATAANPVPARTPAPAVVAANVPAPPATSTPAPVQIAAASPSVLPSRAQPRALVPLSRESPAFPREALAAGVDKGVVRARLSIDASGRVASVEIVDSQPRRVFDRAVSRTLSRWTYEPGAPGRTTDVEIAFNRE
ncbi:MAG: TonB family protein [Betaproteobacteria bacterium]|nr:TonB family protein [Betaproteobacteria bacterium]